MMKQYNSKVSTSYAQPCKIRNEMDISYYGDLDRTFSINRGKVSHQPSEGNAASIEKYLTSCSNSNNMKLEDIFFCQAAPSMGTPFSHSAHIFNGKLNYILSYHTAYISDQRMAFMIRDEIINILRMAVEWLYLYLIYFCDLVLNKFKKIDFALFIGLYVYNYILTCPFQFKAFICI